jgi:DNA-damage-inducible protein D
MEEYNRLTSEDEKRLFLRNEVTKHNLLLADAAKVAGVIKPKANQTHYDVGKKVRQTIEDLGGTMPEDLPTAESIKTIEAKQQKGIKE